MPQDAGDLLQQVALAQVRRAITCLGWRGSRAHSGVHQGRKSMRRVRACLALGQATLGAGAEMIDRELVKVCESISTLRDAQARVECLVRLLANLSQEDMRPCLLRAKQLAVAARTATMRAEQNIDPGFQTRREKLQVLAAAIPVLPWEYINPTSLSISINHSMQRCDVSAEMALARGRDTDWHRLRRRHRRLIQQHTALEQCGIVLPLMAPPNRILATLLGEAQDVSILLHFFRKHPGLSPELAGQLQDYLEQEFEHLSAEAIAPRESA